MIGQQNLSALHAPLKVRFPESTCSLILCLPHILLRQTHPNARNAKSVKPARAAASQPAREHMLFHALPGKGLS